MDDATLDLRQSLSSGYDMGVQLGMIDKATDRVFLGFSDTSPQNVNRDEMADFDGDGSLDRLNLESPQQIAFGGAYRVNNKLLLEADVKWLNWSDANGYEDFHWKDMWLLGAGVQSKPTTKQTPRAGSCYGENLLKPTMVSTGRCRCLFREKPCPPMTMNLSESS
ncbi:hypothetical protein [Desulfosoma caldarium]|uniref:hypothetical protein n=1 Tax=Desulfosoma caldarium TaxID=610254 RepID=UPI000F494591|nr:hypothetical protein [Desulfosoma caldarium]